MGFNSRFKGLSRRRRLILEFCPRIYATELKKKSCKPSVRHLRGRSSNQDTTVCGLLLHNTSPASGRRGKISLSFRVSKTVFSYLWFIYRRCRLRNDELETTIYGEKKVSWPNWGTMPAFSFGPWEKTRKIFSGFSVSRTSSNLVPPEFKSQLLVLI